ARFHGHDKNGKRELPEAEPLLKLLLLSFGFLLFVFSFTLACYAEEITILYTGSTHAMLYPCNCPKEQDGGIARRMSLVKQLRKAHPQALLLDAGGFFAGGLLDEWTQNTELDQQRALLNLKAMELMRYDALNIGSDEFNFGRGFFQENISKTNLNFLSCNIFDDFSFIKPFIIKEISGIKVGIIGLTDPFAKQKLENLRIIEPALALKKSVEELRKNKVNIIVVLSYLQEKDAQSLISNVEGIDVVISAFSPEKEGASYRQIGKTLFLRPSWQGRKLGKAIIILKDNKITGHKIEELRLSDKIQDDPEAFSFMPHCFQDSNCRKDSLTGVCLNPGKLNSQCSFEESNKVNLLILTAKRCKACDTQKVIDLLKRDFPKLAVSYEYYPGNKANDLIKKFSLANLPAYLLSKEVEKEKNFEFIKGNLEAGDNFYILKPEFSGIAYFINRPKIDKKLDLFISLFDKDAVALLNITREFNPKLHFLAVEKEGSFDASEGVGEVEECLRAVCIQKHYPQNFWNYISCRSQNPRSSWWDDCAGAGSDLSKIKMCSRGSEGSALLRENISLNKELKVMFGPVYLIDNQEIFTTKAVPSKEELRKVIKK
ncbi:MAG: hypothetical protein QMD94_03840, partial [Candidatus Omnitrophota bacterium]|nr:hypothetical protein [Candidatus Omnitrophota bacterium]